MKTVELIASGYEWTCPECGKLRNEIEITAEVYCPECDARFEVLEFHHAHG